MKSVAVVYLHFANGLVAFGFAICRTFVVTHTVIVSVVVMLVGIELDLTISQRSQWARD